MKIKKQFLILENKLKTMENKYIIFAAILGFLGTFFEPIKKKEKVKKDYKIERQAEICIDSLRHVNDSLINVLKKENKKLKNENKKLKTIRKHQW